jgi:hypothetical protein
VKARAYLACGSAAQKGAGRAIPEWQCLPPQACIKQSAPVPKAMVRHTAAEIARKLPEEAATAVDGLRKQSFIFRDRWQNDLSEALARAPHSVPAP